MGTQTSVKHARSWRQACTMRKFLMMTDAENRIGELMASDDDQRQIERVTSRTAVEC